MLYYRFLFAVHIKSLKIPKCQKSFATKSGFNFGDSEAQPHQSIINSAKIFICHSILIGKSTGNIMQQKFKSYVYFELLGYD